MPDKKPTITFDKVTIQRHLTGATVRFYLVGDIVYQYRVDAFAVGDELSIEARGELEIDINQN